MAPETTVNMELGIEPFATVRYINYVKHFHYRRTSGISAALIVIQSGPKMAHFVRLINSSNIDQFSFRFTV